MTCPQSLEFKHNRLVRPERKRYLQGKTNKFAAFAKDEVEQSIPLKALQVISRVVTTFKVEMPVKFLLNSPTVAEMADVIVTNHGQTIGQVELARLLGEIELLSDEEAQRLLTEETRSTSRGERHE